MMDYKYKPDGWLGIIVGSKLWIDFSERHKLEININKLIKELGNRGKVATQETIQGATHTLIFGLISTMLERPSKGWSSVALSLVYDSVCRLFG